MKTRLLLGILGFTLLLAAPSLAGTPWRRTLETELPLLGHRNWIVVTDSAYPLQTAPGIETIRADADQTAVVQAVIEALAKTRHVKPVIHTDAELPFVAEADAPGVTTYREKLARILEDQPVSNLPHKEIIRRLDEAGKTFKILLIKTPLALPYTSVFFELECGYWNSAAEQRLRAALAGRQ